MVSEVVVVGSLSLDMVFQVPRRPGKGETVKGFSFETFVGGKGNNQALAAARAGASVAMVGKVGIDSYADMIKEELEKNSVDTSFLFQDQKSGTGLANIYVDPEGDNSIIIVPRANDSLCPEDIDRAKPLIEKAGLMMLQLEVPEKTVVHAAGLARSLNTMVMLNPAPAPEPGQTGAGALPEELYQSIDYLVPNETEAGLLTGIKVTDPDSARSALDKLETMTKATVLITLGEKGVAGKDPQNGEFFLVPAFKVKAVDTTAAGDAFSGCLARELVAGIELKEAVKQACAAGALATTRPGAVPSLPTANEIKELVSSKS